MAKKHVVIDIRPLLADNISGVTCYLESLLIAFADVKDFDVSLFCNSRRRKDFAKWESRFPLIYKRWPNVFLNLCSVLLSWPRLDRFFDKPVDVWLAPDLRPCNLSLTVKKVQVVHDFSWLKFRNLFSLRTRLWFLILRPWRQILGSDRVVVVSEAIKTEYLSLCTAAASPDVSVIEPFLLPVTPSTDAVVNTPEKYFFFVGTLEPRKNIELMLEAFEIFQGGHPDFQLLIAGVVDSKVFAGLNLSEVKNVHYLGAISEQMKWSYLRKAVALLYLSSYEGFGLPVREAIMAGVPSLISSDAALNELAADCALVCDVKAGPELVCAQMVKFLDKNLYQKLQSACINRSGHWDNLKIVDKWLSLLKNL